MEKYPVRKLLFTALFTVLYIVGTLIKIPLGPVPIVLTNLFLFLGALFLGPLWGGASVFLYLALGAAGFPVFSAGGGLALFAGPTGGYLVGYLLGVVAGGALGRIGKGALWTAIPAVIVCALMIYLPGVTWLKFRLGFDWPKALGVGCLPFLPGDALKAAAAVIIWISLRPLWKRLVPDAVTGGDSSVA